MHIFRSQRSDTWNQPQEQKPESLQMHGRYRTSYSRKNRSTRRLRKKLKTTWKQMKMKKRNPNPLGCSKGSHYRKIYCNSGLSPEATMVPNTETNFTPKRTRITAQRQPNVSRSRETKKSRAERNPIESKNKVANINQSKRCVFLNKQN